MHLIKNLPESLPRDFVFCEQKLVQFLYEIQNGYLEKVQYHNDLHGSDVAQMVYIMLTKGKLIENMELGHMDVMSLLVAAVCHDFAHDGFNNAYHVNANTNRSIRSLD